MIGETSVARRKVYWGRIWIGIALVHLFCVFMGAFAEDIAWFESTSRALGFYGQLSGAGDGYGFFTPGVYSQLRAVFQFTDQNGKIRSWHLQSGLNHEADLRVGNIIDQFMTDVDEPEQWRRHLCASLAGTVFGQNPGTTSVLVRLDEFRAVSMSDFRRGQRPRWFEIYSAKFVQKNRQKNEVAKK